MSQKDDSENDIWDYKPLDKKKKRQGSLSANTTAPKRPCTSRGNTKKSKDPSLSVSDKVKVAGSGNLSAVDNTYGPGSCSLEAHNLPSKPSLHIDTEQTVQTQTDVAAEGPGTSGDFCPMCQMPFSLLVVQTQRWHVAECLDTNRDTCTECPDGLQCSSTFPNHYKKFNHTLLAHGRANSGAALLGLNGEVDGCVLDGSQDSALSLSALSGRSVSPHLGTPPSKRNNSLMLLRSPGAEDFKKKKGWSTSSVKKQKSLSSSQESGSELSSTPVKAENGTQASESLSQVEHSPKDDDDSISYSPLSVLPAEAEVKLSECRKALFDDDASESESVVLFADNFSSEDELLNEFVSQLGTNDAQLEEPSLLNTQLEPITSLTQPHQLTSSTQNVTSAINPCSIKSPQSIVLERLRDSFLTCSRDFNDLNDSSVQSDKPHSSSNMPSQKGKAGQSSGLKQTDIGVFFGLKPLEKKEKEAAAGGPNELGSATSTPPGQTRQKKDGRRRRKADTATETPQGTVTEGTGDAVGARGGSGRGGGSRGWRGRWNRGTTDGDGDGEAPPRRCPFYKKIPGTKFVVDAFNYGEVPGITAYFLTHFHSDHYGGLTKKSELPIYCNKITGNLVKSKLRVSEQYVNVLPMNTKVTVEGVDVIFLEANHCPGAAMLLFFLPGGQTVLHTGDFRADPSMETYPELLSCKVTTLYLDTTYCSPEYTFPKQQEVISFAVSTAFEVVTLNPRTLVVCGSYSVGKEKVFMALAEVLGSKVCLSRDKHNTMCCLESEQVRQRITTDLKSAQVHVLPMMHISFRKLQDYLARFSGQYDRLLAFKPTGWTFSQQAESVEGIQPQISGNISIYGIPYSEHSSYLELKRFVQWLKPLKIVPTVNNGSWTSRKNMEKCFSEWLTEAKAKR